MPSYLDKLAIAVNAKDSDSGACNKEIKETYCFTKTLESPKTKTRQTQTVNIL